MKNSINSGLKWGAYSYFIMLIVAFFTSLGGYNPSGAFSLSLVFVVIGLIVGGIKSMRGIPTPFTKTVGILWIIIICMVAQNFVYYHVLHTGAN